MLTDLLKDELGFKGFVVSDWAAIEEIPGDYKSDIIASINAGIDLVMVPGSLYGQNHYKTFIKRLRKFPCKIDYLNRFRSKKEQKNIMLMMKIINLKKEKKLR